MPTVGRPCSVCALAGRVREAIEAEHLAGTPVRAIAAQFAGTASESALRRHLVGSHASRNIFRTSDLDDDLTVAEAIGGATRGLAQLHAVRDLAFKNGNHTTMLRAAAEANRALESLHKLDLINAEKVTADLAALVAYRRAVVATAKRNPIATDLYRFAMAEGSDQHERGVAGQLQRLLDATRTTTTEEN